MCGITDEPLRRLHDAIASEPEPAAPTTFPSWDRASPPRYLDRIDARFSLRSAERSALKSNGFVVAERLHVTSYGEAMDEIVQSQLPLFISADALLAALHAGHEALVVALEQGRLRPTLHKLLDAIACALPPASRDWPVAVTRDIELYVAVARALFREDPTPHDPGAPDGERADLAVHPQGGTDDVDAQTRVIVRALTSGVRPTVAAGPPSAVVDQVRAIDPSIFQTRGHYASAALGLAGYFRAATWLSRIELHLGPSRSCAGPAGDPGGLEPGEAQGEALDALALSELIERADAAPDLETLDQAWNLFAGRRPDLSMTDLTRLRTTAGIRSLGDPLVGSKLRAALDRPDLPVEPHEALQTCSESPAIATMLAPRIEPPAAETSLLVGEAVPQRTLVHATDIAYVLGNDRAKTYLAGDLARWPNLAAGLDQAREDAAMAPAGQGLYGAWLDAIRGLAENPSASAPSFMRTNAWRDLRLDTTVAALAQIRHDAPPATASGDVLHGLSVPDAWVEPIPATIDAMLSYAARGTRAMAKIDPRDTTQVGSYFDRLGRVLAVLREIVNRELSGNGLGDDERRFLGTIAEYLRAQPGCSGDGCPPATCSGWWFDLFVDRGAGAMSDPRLISDYFVSAGDGAAAYVGVGAPRLGIFIVDANGPARAMVGPVATAFETVEPPGRRPSDGDPTRSDAGASPWSASYTVMQPPAR